MSMAKVSQRQTAHWQKKILDPAKQRLHQILLFRFDFRSVKIMDSLRAMVDTP